MEKDFGSKVTGKEVSSYIEDIRAYNDAVYNADVIACEEGECVATLARIVATVEAAAGNPGAARAYSQIKLAESSLYWAKQYKEEGEWGRAAEQISFARIQLKTAEEELGWGRQWQGNT